MGVTSVESMDPHDHHSDTSNLTTLTGTTPGSSQRTSMESCTTNSSDGGQNPGRSHVKSGRALLTDKLFEVRQRLHDPSSPLLRMEQSTKLQRSYIQNLAILCAGFFLLFASFFPLRNMQSSINTNGNLGFISLSCFYLSFIVGCILTDCFPLVSLRPTYAIVLASFLQLSYTTANFFPLAVSLIPAACVSGLSLAHLWTAQGTYVTSLALSYAAVSGRAPEHTIRLFNGVLVFVVQLAQVVGNAVASAVYTINILPVYSADNNYELGESLPADQGINNLRGEVKEDDNLKVLKEDVLNSSQTLDTLLNGNECILNEYRSWKISTVTVGTNSLFIAVLCGLNIAGVIVLTFLGKLDVILSRQQGGSDAAAGGGDAGEGIGSRRSGWSFVKSLLPGDIALQPSLVLLLPMLVYLGVEQGFIYGEMTHIFVSCGLGSHMVGFALVFFCAGNFFTSFLLGRVQASLLRLAVFLTGGILNVVLLSFLIYWRDENAWNMFGEVRAWNTFIVVGVIFAFGVVDGIWQTQACAVVQGSESGSTCLRIHEGLGMCLSFTLSATLSTSTVLSLTGGLLCVALLSYCALITMHGTVRRREEKRRKESQDDQ